MFTGIVTETGKVSSAVKQGSLIRLTIAAQALAKTAVVSDSVAVNGVCLTIVSNKNSALGFDAIASTVAKTNIGLLKAGDRVNLEPALRLGDAVGGHFVLGHIDAALRLLRCVKQRGFYEVMISLPAVFRKDIVPNGSIAVEGISLTVKKVVSNYFTVHIIPYTWQHTTMYLKKPGSMLNIEFDYLLKKKMYTDKR